MDTIKIESEARNKQNPWFLHRRALLAGLAGLGAGALIAPGEAMAAVEQNALRRRGVGLIDFDPERASAGFTLFAPHSPENKTAYLIDIVGKVVHT